MIASSPTLAELARTYETTSDRAPRHIHGCFLATDYHTTAARSRRTVSYMS
jgi:hypothetical protein